MATTAPTPLFTLGNVAQYTKVDAVTDDTNLFSLGNILSFLDYGVAVGGGFALKIVCEKIKGIRMYRRENINTKVTK